MLTGHWHILAPHRHYYAFLLWRFYRIKGKARQWYGWGLIIFSDVALAAVTVYEMRRLFVTEAEQQPLVNMTTSLDIGLGTVLGDPCSIDGLAFD